MKTSNWRSRLESAVEAHELSARAISLKAGHSAGYVHGILVEGKDPTIGKLMAVCDVLGVSLSWVLYGADVTPEDAEIISAMRGDPETRAGILALLRRQQAS